ncbi:hypothetical protein [Absidia glauca]|uniref:Uncharacterized protein n=1 Tax=Absidia glauca TaxID=4829 RepID=A0A163MJP4_ABSGL|nr:hypothetical protein [Absidia glauca]
MYAHSPKTTLFALKLWNCRGVSLAQQLQEEHLALGTDTIIHIQLLGKTLQEHKGSDAIGAKDDEDSCYGVNVHCNPLVGTAEAVVKAVVQKKALGATVAHSVVI